MAINKFHFIFTSTLRLFFPTSHKSSHSTLSFMLLSHLHYHLRPPELLISWKCAENFSSTEIEINFMTRSILFSLLLLFLLGLARFHCLLLPSCPRPQSPQQPNKPMTSNTLVYHESGKELEERKSGETESFLLWYRISNLHLHRLDDKLTNVFSTNDHWEIKYQVKVFWLAFSQMSFWKLPWMKKYLSLYNVCKSISAASRKIHELECFFK